MQYRITYTTVEATTRVGTSDPENALKFALQQVDQRREIVWIADAEGRLFTPREFEKFLTQRR